MFFKKILYLLLISFFLTSSFSEARPKTSFFKRSLIHQKAKNNFRSRFLAGFFSVFVPAELAHLVSKPAQASILELSKFKKDKTQPSTGFYNWAKIKEFNSYTKKYGVGRFALISIFEKGDLASLDFYFKKFQLSASSNIFPEEISLLHLALFLGQKNMSFYLMEKGASLVEDSNVHKLKALDMLFLDQYIIWTDQKMSYELSFSHFTLEEKANLKKLFKEKYPDLYNESEKKMKDFKISY